MTTRIFISCGQNDEYGEIAVAQAVARRLTDLGFEPFIAKEVQSLRSLRENLFPQLRDSEYFLFIDFKREIIGEDEQGVEERRGSLFSHQELAIASYLEIPLLGFRETGVRKLDGLVSAVQANCLEFADRSSLPDLVESEIKKRDWTADWQNRLELSLADPPFTRPLRLPGEFYARFYHIAVRNHHRHVPAKDCFAYLRSVTNAATGDRLRFETVELKWTGYIFPSALISPSSFRKLDAFWVPEPDPKRLLLSSFSDSTDNDPGIVGPGTWRLEYEVLSSSVPGARLVVTVELGQSLDDIRVDGMSHPIGPPTAPASTDLVTTQGQVLTGETLYGRRRAGTHEA